MTSQAKTRREQAIMGVLLLVFGLILTRSLKQLGFFGRPQAGTQKAAVAAEPAGTKSLTEVVNNYRDRFEAKTNKMAESQAVSPAPGAAGQGPAYTAQNLRDPLLSLLPKPPKPPEKITAPVIEKPELPPVKLPELVVNGLVWGGSRPQAVINGKLYSIGETVDGATLTAIAADGVTLEFQGHVIQLGVINSLGAEVPATKPYQYSRR